MITVPIVHSLPPKDGQVSYVYDGSYDPLPAGITERRNFGNVEVDIQLADGRSRAKELSLYKNGVHFVENFASTIDLQTNGLNSTEIVEHYYPQMSALVRDALGHGVVKQALVFDHTIRSLALKKIGAQESNGENIGGYANRAHNDNSSKSAKSRARLLAKDKANGGSVTLAEPPLSEADAERIANGHFGIFNVWRHFNQDYPVLDWPLALLDAVTALPSDFHPTQYIYPHRVGEVVNVHHNPRHRWLYFSEMQHSEALIFKVFDNAAELGLATAEDCPQQTAHTAFRLPNTTKATPPRESIECRVLVEFNET